MVVVPAPAADAAEPTCRDRRATIGTDPRGPEVVTGGPGDDTVTWLSVDPLLVDLAGSVTAGDEIVSYDGVERVSVVNNSETSLTTILGTSGDDEIGTISACHLDLRTGSGDDRVAAITPDLLDVCGFRDVAIGVRMVPGDDELRTGRGLGRDVVDLGPGAEVAFTNKGRDRVSGGSGDDRIFSGPKADRVDDGGVGRDRCRHAEVRHRCEI